MAVGAIHPFCYFINVALCYRNNRKEKTSTNKVKTKTYKSNRRTRKKPETTKQTEETKKKKSNPLPSVQRQDI